MHEDRSYFAALIIVVLAAQASALLLVVALVVWLAEMMGSLTLPCLVVGVALALLALLLYRLSLRSAIGAFARQLQLLGDVGRMINDAVALCRRWMFGESSR